MDYNTERYSTYVHNKKNFKIKNINNKNDN